MDIIPLVLLRKYSTVFPHIWRQIARLREGRGKDLPWWPDWCYIPVVGVITLIQESLEEETSFLSVCQEYPPQVAAALAGWRVTKGIYRFDTDLAFEIASMPIDGVLPAEVFLSLPEWCIYVETPAGLIPDVQGFFVYLEYDPGSAQAELRLVAVNANLEPLIMLLHLKDWSVKEAVESIVKDSVEKHFALFGTPLVFPENYLESIMPVLQPCLNLTLYICSVNADYKERPVHPARKTSRKGKIETATDLRYWDLGVRVGPALRRAKQESSNNTRESTGSHASPRPHYRRAHWHHFWTGPRNNPERRKLVLKWLPPIPVNIPEADDPNVSAVIRPVRV